ncbi:Platinum sensitivity protein [Mortierella sp. GBA39]|nr:Platinum sensitivity protein [Mortierella sp. GBA39]
MHDATAVANIIYFLSVNASTETIHKAFTEYQAERIVPPTESYNTSKSLSKILERVIVGMVALFLFKNTPEYDLYEANVSRLQAEFLSIIPLKVNVPATGPPTRLIDFATPNDSHLLSHNCITLLPTTALSYLSQSTLSQQHFTLAQARISVDRMAASAPNDHHLANVAQKAEGFLATFIQDSSELVSDLASKESCPGHKITAMNDFKPDYKESEEDNMTATLPEPTCTNLKDIDAQLREADQDKEDQLIDFVVEKGYIANLVHLLTACEQAGLTSSLHALRSILLQLINCGGQAVMKEIIRNENFVGCIGILEYDSKLTKKLPYRRVFKTRSNTKQVVPFSNPRTDLWMQDLLRLTFLQETALLHCANYTVDKTLAALVRTNERSVVNEILSEDRAFLTEVFKIAQDPAEPQRRRNDTVKLVHQLFTMGNRIGASVCRTLLGAGLFQLLEYSFIAPDPRVSALGVEILMMATEKRTKLVRSRILHEMNANGRCSLFDTTIDKFIQEENADSGDRLAIVISKLLDVGQEDSDHNYPVFLDKFYSEYCTPLSASILQAVTDSSTFERSSALCKRACELTACIVRAHPARAKLTPLISSDNVEFMHGLLSSQDKSLRLASLRFFRACLTAKDYDYDALLMDNSVIRSVFGLLKETQGTYNIINTACREFIEFISMNGSSRVIIHCATVLSEELDDFKRSPIFHKILVEYELLNEASEPRSEVQQDSDAPLGEYDNTNETSEPPSGGQWDCEVPYVANKGDGAVVPEGRSELSTDTEMPAASSHPLRRKLMHTDFDSDETNSGCSSRVYTAKRTKIDEEVFLSQTTRETAGEPLLAQHPDHTKVSSTPPQPARVDATSPIHPSSPVLRLLLHGVEQPETRTVLSPRFHLTWTTSFSTHRASTPSRLFLIGSSSSTSLPSPPPSPMQPTILGGCETSDMVQISNIDRDTIVDRITLSGEKTTKRKRVEDDSESPEQDPRLRQEDRQKHVPGKSDGLSSYMSHIRDISKRYYVPLTNVTVDEMVIRFVGISKHTYHIKTKPMPVGDKVLSLCAAEYTFAFLPESRMDKNMELVDQEQITTLEGKALNTTSHKVLYLVERLLMQSHTFNVLRG